MKTLYIIVVAIALLFAGVYVTSRLYKFLSALDDGPDLHSSSASDLNVTEIDIGNEAESDSDLERSFDHYRSFELQNARSLNRFSWGIARSTGGISTQLVYAGAAQESLVQNRDHAHAREPLEEVQAEDFEHLSVVAVAEENLEGQYGFHRSCLVDARDVPTDLGMDEGPGIADRPEPETVGARDQAVAAW